MCTFWDRVMTLSVHVAQGFCLRNNHNCTEFLALPFSPFSFLLPFPLPSPPLPLFAFLSFPPRLFLSLPFLLPFHRLRNDLYCVEWGVKLYSNQPILPFPKRWCTWTSEYDQRWRRSRTIAYSMAIIHRSCVTEKRMHSIIGILLSTVVLNVKFKC